MYEEHLKILGMKVIDVVTGFTGIATSLSFDLYGCIQVIITPGIKETGESIEGRWFDISRLEILDHEPIMPGNDYSSGYVAKGKKGPAEKPIPG
jgi:hypothetical protein